MRRSRLASIALAVMALLVSLPAAMHPAAQVVWVDSDMEDIPEPAERTIGFAEHVFEAQIIEQGKQALDLPRWVRKLAGNPKEAANVNALDEVPDSSWYTNRHRLERMSIETLEAGPNSVPALDLDGALITDVKSEGVTPGLELESVDGITYVVKFDRARYPELQSGAEMVSTKILHAAGYNVPENYIATIDPRRLRIADDVEFTDETGTSRALTSADLEELLRTVARTSDGRYRVLASRFLPGVPKGPFAYVGIRHDDPNDRIPHEHRRELRGLRVIASWINHWDLKEQNTLDMYVEEGGRRFLRHYLIDFGSTLGAGRRPEEYYHGRESAFDAASVLKELFSLGLYTSAAERRGRIVSPAVGIFSADDFDPGEWDTTIPVMPFENMTAADALWAVRILLSFTEPELRAIVGAAEYSRSEDARYVLATLLERRRIITRYWLGRVQPLADFAIAEAGGGTYLSFRDLREVAGLLEGDGARYRYELRAGGRRVFEGILHERRIPLDDPDVLMAQTPDLEVRIWSDGGEASEPVRVSLEPGDGGGFRIVRIRRG